jgi:hypothetical protein
MSGYGWFFVEGKEIKANLEVTTQPMGSEGVQKNGATIFLNTPLPW